MTRRSLALLAALFLAATASARTRAVSSAQRPNGATVSGIVSSVSGNTISLANDLITIDASGAKILVERVREADIDDIEAGMVVFATLTSDEPPLRASMVVATRIADATLFGAVDTVDVSANTFTLLGETIHVNDDTSFGGFRGSGKLDDLLPNQIVQVQTDAQGGRLVATSVLILSPVPPVVNLTRGTVKSIGTSSWVIERERDGDLTLVVDAQTKIVGSPKVGDPVEVLYRLDSASAAVAISIVKFDRSPIQNVFFNGTVKTIGTPAWTITVSDGKEQRVIVNERTRVEGGIVAGTRVDVIALPDFDGGDPTALVIVRRR